VEDQLADISIHIPYPYPYRCPVGRACGGCDLACLERGFEAVDASLRSHDPPGAVIVEPIQGRSGGIIPPAEFLPRLCVLARERGMLVIYDEVLTGAGRTGPFWAWERSGRAAEPDLLVGGKGLGAGVAIAALWGRESLMESWRRHVLPSGEAPHSSTFYGHPVACAGALRAVEALDHPEMRARVEAMGTVLAEGLSRVAERRAPVGEVRAAGLLGAIELVGDRASRTPAPALLGRLVRDLWQEGVLTVPGGSHDNVLSLLPPLTISEEQLRWAIEAIDRSLARA
jgi:4-aminobutyrate aminotransferase / (S)-3-amino-2-methylpropionate transaminase / 5-aminovalerate transaminase